MCLRGTHEGINVLIFVPTGHREISVCNEGTKLDNLNSITSPPRIDFVRQNGTLWYSEKRKRVCPHSLGLVERGIC